MNAQKSSVDLVSLTNALPGAVYQLELTESGEWHFHFVSEGIESIYGCSVADLQQNTCVLKDIIVADDYDAVVNSLLDSAKYQIPWNKEYRVVRNGQIYWVYGHAVTEKQSNGSTIWKGQLLDITERKQLELTVKRHQRNLELAERVANLGHWKLNLNTGKSVWSDTVYELYGLEKSKTDPGLDIVMEKTHPEDRKAITDAIEAAKKSGVRDVEHRIIRSDDTVRWLRESGIYQLDENGDEIIFGTVQDITEYKEMELKLRSTGGEDEHTGFYNRRMMLRALQRRFSFYKAHPEYPYFLLVLKVTNDAKMLARAADGEVRGGGQRPPHSDDDGRSEPCVPATFARLPRLASAWPSGTLACWVGWMMSVPEDRRARSVIGQSPPLGVRRTRPLRRRSS